MAQGTAITGVIFVSHHSIAPQPGRSRMPLPTLSKMIVATSFAPKAIATIQLSVAIRGRG